MFTLVTIVKVKKQPLHTYLPLSVLGAVLLCTGCERRAAGKQSGDVTALLSGRCAHSQSREAERRGQTAADVGSDLSSQSDSDSDADHTSATQDLVDSLISAIIQTLELKEEEAASQDIFVSFKWMKRPSRVFPNQKEFDKTTSRHWEHPGLTQPLKSDMDIGQAWVSPGSSTPEYLKEALGMKKPKYSRSASSGYIPGTPDFKEKEDMYDQILDLKKMLQTQKSEADVVKTKLRRSEEENNRKDRQIEQLLDPTRIVNNLKQKILKLEKQCKEKDNALSKLQSELKTTSVEEMRIAMETYYEEIQRLQSMLAKAEDALQRPPPESRDSLRRQKALNVAVLKLSKQVKELQEENKSLKADLDQAMAQSPTSSRSKEQLALESEVRELQQKNVLVKVPAGEEGYSEWSKQRLVRKISELEKAQKESHGSRPGSVRSSSSASSGRGSNSSFSGGEKKRKQEAAQLIQKNWRQYQSRKEENKDMDE
ncbi:unnamed protein product, partial [Ranitomeya imitator]